MNTNRLKRFAQEARKKLIQQVDSRMELVMTTDSAELREKAVALSNLKNAITSTSKEQVIDKVAYTWFNRLMALRFMDLNEYQPTGVKIVTPKEGYTLPEILEDARQGQIPDELPVNKEHIYDLLDGKVSSSNAQNEVYKELLIAACNQLHSIFPFLFEKIDDYTELLLPDDLTSEFSIINEFLKGMVQEDCGEVEVIGWLYQFYISELNDKLISSKKKYKTEDLAPASQLFTPKWIVQYMVDNTLGQIWTEFDPNTNITSSLEYYIKPDYLEELENRESKSIEEIKFFEPCVGSGHILSYAFDVFYKIYEEQGYNPSEIPELIITNNLYGVDIDERASQIASFVLLMKGREKHRRFLRIIEKKNIIPNISFYQDFEFDKKFENASALGSLIEVTPEEVENYKIDENSIFSARQEELKKLYSLLGQRYDVVVTNPPYIGASRMEPTLKNYVANKYPETKSDLFACFILKSLELCSSRGLTGYMTPFVWMFIYSYEKLRKIIIDNHFINNLIQLEYSGFDGATVPICTFTLRKQNINKGRGNYIRLSNFKGAANQAPKTLEAIQNPNCGWRYRANHKDFQEIPGMPIGYWASTTDVKIFKENTFLGEISNPKKGLDTGDNDRFLRLWFEPIQTNIEIVSSHSFTSNQIDGTWYPINRGGGFRKWYGNNEYLIHFKNDGFLIKNTKNEKGRTRANLRNEKFYFQESLTWGAISSAKFSARYCYPGGLFGAGGYSVFAEDKNRILAILGFFSSKLSDHFLKILSPTLNFEVGNISSLPYKLDADGNLEIIEIVEKCIEISRNDWDSREISWDFSKNELIRIKSHDIERAYDEYCLYWFNQFNQLHQNEEKLNQKFITSYCLQDELSQKVDFDYITILKDETDIVNGELVFDKIEIFAQFISYAVGCMFGRYSLVKEGLILANQGETLEGYLKKVGKGEAEVQFLPDEDNIIPVLDDEWFEDDIVGRFYEFLKASFGKENFDKNLAFVEESIGKDIRKYFVRDFYKDHVKRYKKRPIYWMFSSPKGSFNVLIYMHRYTPDTLNSILNGYLIEYREKLKARIEHLDHIIETGSSTEQTRAAKEKDGLRAILLELQEYEREILYPLATERISIDLDDGVLVNYNKFGKAIQEVKGLNDKKAKEKVRKFDWIETAEII
ncbi:BREX-1 system adenine-specific DNA-methyltransferase PglX [Christiangramia echinicola]|uniref:site-specific DNA-methyltransferase (adenine-specific) n=1 Tax=Christiangramia echinicola TaxID=279359 RepID=A0A1H1RKN8_9FLAO|nr:BREX-1 system adenine-specific DNA-methyltransferase PglX [Christiangramia echinicola]SDS36076.1 Type II restriction/modification system, DNA methylase subunit YeeA [Christiangramia echinicola]